MTISEMLDLPKPQRSKFLAAMPLTRDYVFGCLDEYHIKHIRRIITRNGGVWREYYATPGLAVTATFRTHAGMLKATRELVHWLNDNIRKNNEAGLPEQMLSDLFYNEDFGLAAVMPVMNFEIVNGIDLQQPVKHRVPSHPIRG